MDRPSLPAVDVCVCVCVATSLVEILVMPSVERKGEEGRVRKEEGRKKSSAFKPLSLIRFS